MNCLRCEVFRAKVLARCMWALGKNPDAIAASLSQALGADYFVDKGEVWRSNNPRPIKISGKLL